MEDLGLKRSKGSLRKALGRPFRAFWKRASADQQQARKYASHPGEKDDILVREVPRQQILVSVDAVDRRAAVALGPFVSNRSSDQKKIEEREVEIPFTKGSSTFLADNHEEETYLDASFSNKDESKTSREGGFEIEQQDAVTFNPFDNKGGNHYFECNQWPSLVPGFDERTREITPATLKFEQKKPSFKISVVENTQKNERSRSAPLTKIETVQVNSITKPVEIKPKKCSSVVLTPKIRKNEENGMELEVEVDDFLITANGSVTNMATKPDVEDETPCDDEFEAVTDIENLLAHMDSSKKEKNKDVGKTKGVQTPDLVIEKSLVSEPKPLVMVGTEKQQPRSIVTESSKGNIAIEKSAVVTIENLNAIANGKQLTDPSDTNSSTRSSTLGSTTDDQGDDGSDNTYDVTVDAREFLEDVEKILEEVQRGDGNSVREDIASEMQYVCCGIDFPTCRYDCV